MEDGKINWDSAYITGKLSVSNFIEDKKSLNIRIKVDGKEYYLKNLIQFQNSLMLQFNSTQDISTQSILFKSDGIEVELYSEESK